MANTLDMANNVLFGDLCNLLEKLSKKKIPVKEKEKMLNKYIQDFKCKVAKEIAQNKNTSFFPILRLLVPSIERERGAYNMKESKLGDLLVKVLSLNKQSYDARRLLDRALNNQDGDFGNVAYSVLNSRVAQKTSTLTVGDINDLLDKIASAEVGNKRTILDDLFSKIIRNLTAEQIKWFLRIILKDLKLGMSSKRILYSYHPDAPDLYDTCGSLSKTCDELEDGDVRPLELGVETFYAVSPMLSERLNVVDISDLSRDNVYIIEEKFDGERFQIHMQDVSVDSEPNHVFQYFSRKGFSFTSTFGKNYDSGLLTPRLRHCFSSQVNSFILDGEMMGWDKTLQCFGSKGMAFDVKKLTPMSRYQPCFCVFDILYFNGQSLVGPEHKGGLKLSDRLRYLDTMFIDVRGAIQHSKRSTVTQSSEILAALNKAIDNQEEGIVVKDFDSYYIANKRNAGWYKIKPEYTEEAIEDLDLVIIGADAAENAKHGKAKSFLLAVAAAIGDAGTQRWVCVGRVATGLTYEQRESVCSLLEKHWHVSSLEPPPRSLYFNRIKPDFWILPEHSVVLQVRATELIPTYEFGSTYTLRFPRVKRVRDDKPVSDIMTLDQFNKLIEDRRGGDSMRKPLKLGTKRIGEELIGEAEAKMRKKRTVPLPQVPDELRVTSVGDVEVISNALKGRKLCILSDEDDCKKDELIRIVESHAGRVVANPGPDVWCCIVGRHSYRARNVIASGDADVAPVAWLRGLPPAPRPCVLAPLDLRAMRTETRLACAREYDQFGDHYVDLATEDTVKRCFKKMDDCEPEIFLTLQEMMALDQEVFGNNNPFSFFRSCVLHINSGYRSILAIRSKMYGATIRDLHDRYLTHVVVPKDIKLRDLQDVRDNIARSRAVIVSEDWMEECFKSAELVSEKDFTM